MRVVRTALVVAFSLVLVVTGCSRQITGTAQVDPNQTLASITKDGFGIRAGSEEAPVQVELYTEPQCSHCADLQHDFGDQIAYYIGIGALAVTYRPVTFLDQVPDGYSAHVAKAMFAAAAPGGAEGTDGTTARAFQHFVQDLWGHQDLGGPGPSENDMADMAQKSGIPASQVDAIASGASDVDTKNMTDTNMEFLFEIDQVNTGTPTIYDLKKDEKIDIYDNDWLSKLMAS
ncbi:thioredoxin domain-containing protein [Mycobacterium sp. AZCC_0083]|uniref:DsbA family protein n=1 Tax=Mycobacterium sp. AZCC_0083 TaxID=2735882 RepID=UPI00160B9986|nr:thioredoxin domain-containing protein [Mycobacterium sp. AZCC_0083]MBB5161625.1 protein-disulfide isomerase [Mycobacterium sp. AZCC_0083]